MKQLNFLLTRNIRKFKTITVFTAFVLLFGCATGSSIITGTKRPAINPSEVTIYLDPPADYENIGIIEVSSEVGFSRQKAQDRAMEALKSRAAKVGANGVLLTNTGSQTVGTAGYYSNGIYFGGSSDKILAHGRAIYVIKE